MARHALRGSVRRRSIGSIHSNSHTEGGDRRREARVSGSLQGTSLPHSNRFYEWKKLGPKEKQPYAIVMKDRALFAFAGLWERWKDKASGEIVRSCTIVTTTPNEVCAPFHDRMPVIVDAENYGKWLGEEDTDPVRFLIMLKPFPAEKMTCYPVDSKVGKT